MKIKPLYDRIVVEAIASESRTAGGIHIPDTAKDKPKTGKVIAVGPGNYSSQGNLVPLDVKVSDTVLFNKNSGSETKLDGKTYLIMKESDIIAILED